MRGKGVALAALADLSLPVEPAVGRVDLVVAAVLLVPSLGMHHLAEKALADQVPDQHHVALVAVVLQQHAMPVGLLGRLDLLPALLHRQRRGNLGGHVLAGLQRGQHDRRVQRPGRGVDHQVEVLSLAHPPVVGLAPAVALRPGQTVVLDQPLSAGGLDLIHVADRPDLDLCHAQQQA